jgi:hypothetical protein
MFAAGLHSEQLGDGQYWGHNAIIRVQPFAALRAPKLPGTTARRRDPEPRLRRGGADEARRLDPVAGVRPGGSYEEVPSTLLEEMKRDRRWCQGNLQHLRLLFTEGLFGPPRPVRQRRALLRFRPALVHLPGAEHGRRIIDSCTSPAASRTARVCFRNGRCGGPTGRSRC